MYSKVNTCCLEGLNGYVVECECDLANGLRSFNIVGLPDTSIKESKERVRSAIENTGIRFPVKRITINLAPANLRKEGSQLDLAIAMAILQSMGVVEDFSEKWAFIGELSLDGRLNPVNGSLCMVLSLKDLGYERVYIPKQNAQECSMVKGIEKVCVESLDEIIRILNGEQETKVLDDIDIMQQEIQYDVDFSDIKGQKFLKRAMEISAAGFHNLLMIGPPGSGKTMSAMRLSTILPDMSFDEIMETTKIYSVAGLLGEKNIVTTRPFRSPHHTASQVSLIGGGRVPKPGEISLAHNGALFLDELPEFSKSTIEVLRQPLETKNITITRVNASLSYPANFLFVAGMNPCPCGYFGDPNHECTCSQNQIANYLNKVSRPILDRIDIHVEVSPVKLDELTTDEECDTSEQIKKRVQAAREIQKQRFEKENITTNAQMNTRQIRKYCKLNDELNSIIQLAFDKYKFSARSFDKILKISRTIADLDGKENIEAKHLMEAIRYRTVDQKYWG
ncbi:MAG: YifB family Mg chelatase-like AAA ATPase [Finegoldia magna]|nr:YifB family Mg chelatase-like AAA ATPase [Finegoldia magna]